MRIDDGLVKNVISEICDRPNFADIFVESDPREYLQTDEGKRARAVQTDTMSAVIGPKGAQAMDNMSVAAINMLGAMADNVHTDLSVGEMNDIFKAKSVRIELPLTDGSPTVLELAPQEPAFQYFAAQCGAPIADARRGSLGLTFRMVSPEFARQSHLSLEHGIFVEATDPFGPAAKAGLRSGDVLTALNGKPLADGDELGAAIFSFTAGTTVTFDVNRGGASIKVPVTLGSRAASGAAPASPGITAPAGSATPARAGNGPLSAANPMNTRSRVGAPGPPPLFNGTADQLAGALPGYLQRAKPGINAADFATDLTLITKTVRACARITPALAKTAALSPSTEDLARLGDDYKPCQTGITTTQGLSATFRPVGAPPSWQNPYGFVVTVTLAGTGPPATPVVYAKITGGN